MKRIRKNATRQIAAIAEAVHTIQIFNLDNCFRGEECKPQEMYGVRQAGGVKEWIMKEISWYSRRNGLFDNGGGVYTLHVHSNLWFRLCTNYTKESDDEDHVQGLD